MYKILYNIPTAAAVFEFGVVVQSPIPKTFGYFRCCNVSFETFRNPLDVVNSLFSCRTFGVHMGGVT